MSKNYSKTQKSEYVVQAWEQAQFSHLKGAIKRDTRTALAKFRHLGRIQVCLAVITTLLGAALIAIATSNLGFPVFNFGPLLTGIVELVAGVFALLAARHEIRNDEYRSGVNVQVKLHFGLNALAILLSAVSLIIAGMATALCAGWDNEFYYSEAGARYNHNYDASCSPNTDAKVILSAANAGICLCVFAWNCYTVCVFCAYGSLFGLSYRGY